MWAPLHQHSCDGSWLDGLSQPRQLAARLKECGYSSGALTDHGSLAGVPAFFREMRKNKLKPVAGLEAYVCEQHSSVKGNENRRLSHLVILARSKRGWRNLMRLATASERGLYYKPRLSLEEMRPFAEGLFAVSGHPGSTLGNCVWQDAKLSYRASSEAEARSLLRPDWLDAARREIARHKSAFGGHFAVEAQLFDRENLPAQQVLTDCLRRAAELESATVVATADSHYCRREDAPDQRLTLCVAFKTTLEEVQKAIARGEDVTLGGFFNSSNYHVPDRGEMAGLHRPGELRAALELADSCEDYDLGRPPCLPEFPCPEGAAERLRAMCRAGWSRLGLRGDVYAQRARMELEVLTAAGLPPYFLIVEDYARWAREQGMMVGERGSASGCLVSYMAGITGLDPVRHKLNFERFYNASRAGSLPDIDLDFPVERREEVFAYLRGRYGEAHVAPLATYGRMQGKSALKDVLRARHGRRLGEDELNEMTLHIPDQAAVADDLQEMEDEEEGSSSLIRWALENRADALARYCRLDGGVYSGDFASEFAQAARLEGTVRSRGRHASGVVVTSVPVEDLVPMVSDKGQMAVGLDYRDAEELGVAKFDILGNVTMDNLSASERMLRGE